MCAYGTYFSTKGSSLANWSDRSTKASNVPTYAIVSSCTNEYYIYVHTFKSGMGNLKHEEHDLSFSDSEFHSLSGPLFCPGTATNQYSLSPVEEDMIENQSKRESIQCDCHLTSILKGVAQIGVVKTKPAQFFSR